MSQSTSPRLARRGLAAATVFAVAGLGLLAGGSAAYAADIDPTETGSITIHKFENPGDGAMNPDGTGTSPTKPIAGVGFEVCLIDGIDLKTDGTTGWEEVNEIPDSALLAAQQGTQLGAYSLTGCQTLADTDAQGTAATGTLALGAYLVREVKAPENVVKKADPFIVTVPTPSINGVGADGSWVYDVHVYPKNTVGNGPVKRIDDQTGASAAVGSDVNFSIEQVIPALATGETYDKLTLTDTLDSRLTPKASTVEVLIDGTALAAGDFTATVVGQKLTVVLNQGGLDKLTAGATLRVEFAATISSVGDGVLLNTAYVNLNDLELTPGHPGDPENPTNTVVNRWGQAKVNKVDTSGNGLTGAEFEVLMGDRADCNAADITFTPVMNPAAPAQKLVVPSTTDGVIEIPGLWIGSDSISSTGAETIGLSERCYQLVETKAPAGFILPEGDDAKFDVVVKPGETANLAIDIENKQQVVPPLPMTGAEGQLAMVIGGFALMAIAGGSVLVTRRKKQRA